MSAVSNELISPARLGAVNGKGVRGEYISVIAPVYNEEESIVGLYAKVKAAMEELGAPWELILVDDGSQDRSAQLMDSLSCNDFHVKTVKLRRNFGQTAALSAGIDQAQGDVIIPIDADLQNDPEDIAVLLAKMDEGYDVVSGWRKCRKDPLSKRIPSFFANKLASWLTGVHLHDYGCTLKAYRREVLQGIHLYGELHRFIPALASSLGAKVGEVEVNHHPRLFGKSKYGLTRTLKVVLDLLTLKLLLAYYNRPMRIFGGMGLLCLALGWVSAIITVMMKLLADFNMTGNPFLFITILAVLSGVQLIGMGFLGELNMRTYYESQRKPIYVIREIVDQDVSRLR